MKRFRTWCDLVITCKSLKQDYVTEISTRRLTETQPSKTNRLQMVCSAVRVVKRLRVDSREQKSLSIGPNCYRLTEERTVPSVSSDQHNVSVL